MLSTSVHKTQRHSQHYLRKKKKSFNALCCWCVTVLKEHKSTQKLINQAIIYKRCGVGVKKKTKNEEKSYHAKIQNLFEDHTKIAVVTIYRKELD